MRRKLRRLIASARAHKLGFEQARFKLREANTGAYNFSQPPMRSELGFGVLQRYLSEAMPERRSPGLKFRSPTVRVGPQTSYTRYGENMSKLNKHSRE